MIENNKLIAEFMGCKVTIFKGKEYIRLINEPYVYMTNGMDEPDDMLFHESWDWLMPVVEKIEKLGFFVTIRTVVGNQTKCVICNYKQTTYLDYVDFDKITVTYQNIIKFIKWYNRKDHGK